MYVVSVRNPYSDVLSCAVQIPPPMDLAVICVKTLRWIYSPSFCVPTSPQMDLCSVICAPTPPGWINVNSLHPSDKYFVPSSNHLALMDVRPVIRAPKPLLDG
ncbi:hypothetical protein AVEN_37322-1 [Araneus ventricosus]|uniref:Uncharacterized protein n=1 Tax=Araneus ventricosus TaxID=182803 RepID=A0A4Y2W6F8_ARAVE|nr:hypothetical protein AVEN_37322-1 [Araneus ventricosus]